MAFYNTITNIQIEHSSMCNAACPQCLREWWGGDHSRIRQTYLPTEFYENNIPQYVYDKLTKINFCGDVGDPCTGPNFIDVCRVVKRKNPNIQLTIATNGGMRDAKWWSELASVLTEHDHVIFGIDGLEDTNWIYRVNVRWSKLMENVNAFISNGGNAMWQFVSFEHNEHQIEQAKELSKELGFKNFFTIYNNRFAVEKLFKRSPSLGADGKVLKPPKKQEEISKIIRDGNLPDDPYEWGRRAEKTCITCQAQTEKEAYIDAEGHLLPCCYIAGAKFTLDPNGPDGYYDLWTTYGNDKINLNFNTWEEILSGDFYRELEERWTKTFATGRLLVCSGTCGKPEAKFTEYKNRKHG